MDNRMFSIGVCAWLMVCIVFASPAVAQPTGLFVDSFSGPVLHPRWSQPAPEDWRFGMINDRLEVYRVGPQFFPGPPIQTTVELFAGVRAVVNEVRMVVGLEGPDIQRDMVISAGLGGLSLRQIPNAGSFVTRLTVGGGGVPTAVELPAQVGVPYDVRVRVSGGRTVIWVNGQIVAEANAGSPVFTERTLMSFTGPRSQPVGTMWIDEIAVIPAPGSAFLLLAALGAAGTRRRRP